VAAQAFDLLGLPRSDLLGFTMPGFGTSKQTKTNAVRLMEALGVTWRELDIRPAAQLMLTDLDHPFARGEPVYDVTFENVQAGLRTDYLFRLANRHKGFVLGTGDLSELALGWCTYGVGDQMSHYNVNAGIPKTLIQHLIRWVIASRQFDQPVLDTPPAYGSLRHRFAGRQLQGGGGWTRTLGWAWARRRAPTTLAGAGAGPRPRRGGGCRQDASRKRCSACCGAKTWSWSHANWA
jgi:NH3-dependent NAD+ synthetase